MMTISIIIPVYNAEKTLEACLRACLKQRLKAIEVIVVDDGSTDASAAIAASFPEVRYIGQANQGPAAARNTGAKAARGEWIAFTDSDCIPREDWLEHLAAALSEEAVGVGGTYAIANPEAFLARLVHAEIILRHQRFTEEVDFLGSFNVAYNRRAFEKAGGFDPQFRQASGEDNDLAYRLQDAGGHLRFSPKAIVAHHHPERIWPYLKTQARHGYWRVLLYRKHPGRAGGDQYAGPAALLAPPLAIGLLLFFPGLVLIAFLPQAPHTLLSAGYVLAWLLQSCLHLPMVLKLCRISGSISMTGGLILFPLRDIARGLGLLAGVWRFSFSTGVRQ